MNRPKLDVERVAVCLDPKTLAEVKRECQRQGRSVSWLMRTAWKVAKHTIATLPGRPA